jgi:hypothetical protein
MRPKLATLMQHLKAANARIDMNLKAIEGELLQLGDAEAARLRRIREDLAAITEMLPGHVNGAEAADD